MRKYLIGPVLTAAGYIAGSHYGAQAQQVVHKSPDETYTGVSQPIRILCRSSSALPKPDSASASARPISSPNSEKMKLNASTGAPSPSRYY